MSDAEEEVKTHPCDKYKIPDCPGMIAKIRVEISALSQQDTFLISMGTIKFLQIHWNVFGIIFSRGNESS